MANFVSPLKNGVAEDVAFDSHDTTMYVLDLITLCVGSLTIETGLQCFEYRHNDQVGMLFFTNCHFVVPKIFCKFWRATYC